MKKFLPYILTLVVIVNLIAPFSVGLDKNKQLSLSKNTAFATEMTDEFFLDSKGITTDSYVNTPVQIYKNIPSGGKEEFLAGISMHIKILNPAIEEKGVSMCDWDWGSWDAIYESKSSHINCGLGLDSTVWDSVGMFLEIATDTNFDRSSTIQAIPLGSYIKDFTKTQYDITVETENLGLNATYYARILFEEDGPTDEGHSEIISFKIVDDAKTIVRNTNGSIVDTLKYEAVTMSPTSVNFIFTFPGSTKKSFLRMDLYNDAGLYVNKDGTLGSKDDKTLMLAVNGKTTTRSYTGLKENTTYQVKYDFKYYDSNDDEHTGSDDGNQTYSTTNDPNAIGTRQEVRTSTETDMLPACGLGKYFGTGEGTFTGCLVQAFYWIVFVPTSYLFGLAGIFFDYTLGYSISDSSYRTSFVTQGWAIVRDICNIFFIFVLLYAAFKMIFGSHGAKSVVVNVIIIGVLINFSLLATQILVDTSNILAKLFYSSDAIKITTDANGGTVQSGGINLYDIGQDGTIPLSAAIVSKVNPQNIILNADQVTVHDDKTGSEGVGGTDNNSAIGTGTFFLVILLSTIINLVGTFVFISIGIMFIARVIGLWLVMVFAPFAFFSYTVPKMSKAKYIGWTNWWSDLLGLCFMAPLFMFFMYLIVIFLEQGFSGVFTGATGATFVLGVILPFAFIMILLMTAKSLAKSYSGSIGQTVTGAVTAAGGAILGGAALGAAFIGRNTVGGIMKGAATGNTAAQRYERGESKGRWDKLKGKIGHTVGESRMQKTLGNFLNKKKDKAEHIGHAQHILDQEAGNKYHGKKWADLNATQRTEVKNIIDRNAIAEAQYGKKYGALDALAKTWVNNNINNNASSHLVKDSLQKQGIISRTLESATYGKYDLRNMSKVVSKSYESWLSKLGTGLTAVIGSSMREGFKKIPEPSVNYGQGQGHLLKDLGSTIKDALKSVNFEVKGGGHDDHGGGHDDHGGGHH